MLHGQIHVTLLRISLSLIFSHSLGRSSWGLDYGVHYCPLSPGMLLSPGQVYFHAEIYARVCHSVSRGECSLSLNWSSEWKLAVHFSACRKYLNVTLPLCLLLTRSWGLPFYALAMRIRLIPDISWESLWCNAMGGMRQTTLPVRCSPSVISLLSHFSGCPFPATLCDWPLSSPVPRILRAETLKWVYFLLNAYESGWEWGKTSHVRLPADPWSYDELPWSVGAFRAKYWGGGAILSKLYLCPNLNFSRIHHPW